MLRYYSTQHFDLNKPFKFTMQDLRFGQFESIAYLAANLAANTDNTAANDSNNISDSNNTNDANNANNTNEDTMVNSNSISLIDSEGRFSAKVTRNNDELQLTFDAKQQRHYVIFHYVDQQGLKQNVHLSHIDGYQWTWQGSNIDVMKPVQFTVHDMHIGQFSSSEYSLEALQVDSATDTTESASDSSNNSNHNDDQRIEVDEARFSLLAVINQSNGTFNITLNTQQERAYEIIHYVDKQGIPQNRHLIQQENNQWQLDTDSFDQSKGFSLTIDDLSGQFSTEKYVF